MTFTAAERRLLRISDALTDGRKQRKSRNRYWREWREKHRVRLRAYWRERRERRRSLMGDAAFRAYETDIRERRRQRQQSRERAAP